MYIFAGVLVRAKENNARGSPGRVVILQLGSTNDDRGAVDGEVKQRAKRVAALWRQLDGSKAGRKGEGGDGGGGEGEGRRGGGWEEGFAGCWNLHAGFGDMPFRGISVRLGLFYGLSCWCMLFFGWRGWARENPLD